MTYIYETNEECASKLVTILAPVLPLITKTSDRSIWFMEKGVDRDGKLYGTVDFTDSFGHTLTFSIRDGVISVRGDFLMDSGNNIQPYNAHELVGSPKIKSTNPKAIARAVNKFLVDYIAVYDRGLKILSNQRLAQDKVKDTHAILKTKLQNPTDVKDINRQVIYNSLYAKNATTNVEAKIFITENKHSVTIDKLDIETLLKILSAAGLEG